MYGYKNRPVHSNIKKQGKYYNDLCQLTRRKKNR